MRTAPLPSRDRHRRLPWLFVPALLLVLLSGCQTPQPQPTPTATRTPILPTPTPTLTPTPTPTPTATPTLTPSPTLPPELMLPAEPIVVEACPRLPTDLYYLRDDRLWVCLAEGGSPEQISLAADAEGQRVLTYRVARDSRYVAYVTDAGELFVLDRALWQHTYVPTSGRLVDEHGIHLEITADGSTLFYLAWGVQPNAGPAIDASGSATLLAVDAADPTRLQETLGHCQGRPDRPCAGFLLAPDESRLALFDAEGIWLIDRETPEEPHLLGAAPSEILHPMAWSPDGNWVTVTANWETDPVVAAVSIGAQAVTINPAPFCSAPCKAGAVWVADRLWVTWDTPTGGCVATPETALGAPPVVAPDPAQAICTAGPVPLHPQSPGPVAAALPAEAAITLLQRRVPGLWPGIYAYRPAGELLAVALLPDTAGLSEVSGDELPTGDLLWTHQGDAFLYLEEDSNARYAGTVTWPALWDVGALLEGAHAFSWGFGEVN